MLPPGYHWIHFEGGAYLHYNAACVASVSLRRGRWVTSIRFRQQHHEAPCGSLAQGMRWVERWMAKQRMTGFPGGGKLRWYDRVQAR